MSQIFKRNIPSEMLFEILNEICPKNDKCYTVNNMAYKKGVFNECIAKFIELCVPFYYESKLKYLERKLTYQSFITIIRQICNYNNIKYASTIKYDKSKYDIVYNIYFDH